MGAYKRFTTNDVTVSPLILNKELFFDNSNLTSSGIEIYKGQKPLSNNFYSSSVELTGFNVKQNTTGVYFSIKQLYYTNYLSSSKGDNNPPPTIIYGVNEEDNVVLGEINTPRYENYIQSSFPQERYFPLDSLDEFTVISIPQSIFGENILPKTFNINYKTFNGLDDGEGNIKTLQGDVIGQIFYSHGIIVLITKKYRYGEAIYGESYYGSNNDLSTLGSQLNNNIENLEDLNINFKASHLIYENQYKCSFNENEFLYSLNPSLLIEGEDYKSIINENYFTPYITNVGLYNENNELLVIGKLSQPIPISRYIDTNILVNFDT